MSGAENPCILLLSFFVLLCPKKQKKQRSRKTRDFVVREGMLLMRELPIWQLSASIS